jgi:hypothetical protein
MMESANKEHADTVAERVEKPSGCVAKRLLERTRKLGF